MASCHDALLLAQAGFHIFPCNANQKTPRINDWPKQATRNPEQIEKWFKGSNHNIGISTEHFREDLALIVVDIDCKEKDGFNTLAKLAEEGFNFPPTLTQTTPSGGMHFIYWARRAVKQGTSVFGENSGIDIRSRGGYIVAPGSHLPNGDYKWINANEATVVEAPAHVLEFLNKREFEAKKVKFTVVQNINQETAKTQAIEYLKNLPPVSSGSRNQEGFKVACRLKDFGCTPEDISFLMLEYWKCEPMLDPSEIDHIVNSAFNYGKNDPGVDSPEAIFGPAKQETPPPNEPPKTDKAHPFMELNKEFFFVVQGGQSRIYREHTDENGKFKLESLRVPTFHDMLRPQTLFLDGRTHQLSEKWFDSPSRREYKGVIFFPGELKSKKYYNLWRGFSVPSTPRSDVPALGQQAFDLFLEHTTQNICDGDFELAHWLIGYFAHLIQKPLEKPGVAIVLKGMKGTGKNVFVETIGSLLGNHSVVVSDRRYLVGNFNSLLENKLLFTLDEAFWSGDKAAEGILKALVTGKNKVVEKKGLEPEEMRSLERVVIIGNEDWLVPATADERRFAVFNIGNSRRNDRAFFGAIADGMENHGGLSALLHYLQHYDLSGIEVRKAPNTRGLAEQKEQSLDLVSAWWFQCLREGRVLGYLDNQDSWPTEISTKSLLTAIRYHLEEEGSRGWVPNGVTLGKRFKTVATSSADSKVSWINSKPVRCYQIQPLQRARDDWDKIIGHLTDWS